MTTYRFIRKLNDGSRYILGHATQNENGWRFIPNVFGKSPSRKSHPTMRRCLPHWVGYPDHCESEEVPR
jgi:hypothetical protein